MLIIELLTSVFEWMLRGRVREGARLLWLECSGEVSTIFATGYTAPDIL
jgi:hypothetical protein